MQKDSLHNQKMKSLMRCNNKVNTLKKAIVTGAAGFAGCNLVEALLKKGYYIHAIMRPQSSHNARLHASPHLKIIECDMQDYAKLPEKIQEKCDVFYHLAWQGGRHDFDAQFKNIAVSLVALESASKLECKRFVCTGSQAEYGPKDDIITEATSPNPVDAYGAAKLATNILTLQRAKELNIEWIWGRIFSLYGKYEPGGRMLPDLIKSLKEGIEFKLSAATQMWDYLYSTDGAEALIALGEYGRDGEIYNIANGNSRPLKEFVEAIRKEINPDGKITYGKTAGWSLQASVDKIHKDTGWSAQTEFLDGIRLAKELL